MIRRMLLIFVVLMINPQQARLHSFGSGSPDISPPLKLHAEELRSIKNDFGNSSGTLRGVFNDMKLWNAGTTLRGCFFDGDRDLKRFFVKTSKEWLKNTSLRFDFGDGDYNDCSREQSSELRVSFAQKGNWSYIGTDSLLPSVVAAGPSLNIQTDKKPFDAINRRWLREVVLHEIGHALGLLHEHQSPESRCGEEFNWERIVKQAQDEWGWDESEVRTNFEMYHASPRLRTTPYDRKSIMHYSLAEWMFKRGKKSRCHVPPAHDLSQVDRKTIGDAYPVQTSQQKEYLQSRADVASLFIAKLNLNVEQLHKVADEISSSLGRVKRAVSLSFILNPDSATRAPQGALKPCGTSATAQCSVAPDASSLFVTIREEN